MKYKTGIVLRYFFDMGLNRPVTEHQFAAMVKFTGKDGRERTRKWAFDFAWLEQKVALEVEGGIWTGGRHTRGAGFSKDIEKYNTAVTLGWRVVKCVPGKLCTEETIELLRKLLK